MTISVIIPAYNRESLIGDTLRSLLSQTLPAKEIIVVDDGSTDGTAEEAAAFGAPVKVVRTKNTGPAAARNHGLSLATGEFIHFFDSDDLALPNKHEVQLRCLEESKADIAYSPWIKGEFSGECFRPQQLVLQQKGLPKVDLVKALLTDWSIVPHACLFRRSIVEKAGGFPETLRLAEDQLMFLRCLLHGASVIHSPGTLELYRTGTANKLTEAKKGHGARIREWARFLVLAHETCLAHQTNPCPWPGFRRRAWKAREDLLQHGDAGDAILINKLESLFAGQNSMWKFRAATRLSQIGEGLRGRLTGSRYASSFRCGALTDNQKAGIAKMGLHLHGK